MPALLIKDVPPTLHEKLKEEAGKHHRSMTKEALCILEQGLGATSARSLRDVKPVSCGIRIDDSWIRRAKEWGRS
jgi:plasmid stability protein